MLKYKFSPQASNGNIEEGWSTPPAGHSTPVTLREATSFFYFLYDDDDDDSYSIRHWTDVPPGEVCFVPLFIAGST